MNPPRLWIRDPLRKPVTGRYGLALAVTIVAVAVRQAADPLVGDQLPLATMFAAVAAVVWTAGTGPAIFAAVIGYAACNWLFISPRYEVSFTASDVYSFVLYSFATSLIIAIGARMQEAEGRARENAVLALRRQEEAERALRERAEAAAAARESDERLRVAIKNSRFVLTQCDANLRYTWVHNPQPEFDSADVIGKRDDELDSSDASRRLIELKRRVLETGHGETADISFQRADGARTLTFTLEPLRDPAGAVVGVTSAAVDITDRKRVEDALRQSEELFRALAENVPQLAWMAGPDGSMFWCNRRWFEFTGTTLADVIGWGWRQVQHPDHVDRVTAGFRSAIERAKPWEDTFPMRAADGRYRWFLTRAFPIRDTAGQVTRWFGTCTDITVLRDTQEALRDAQRQVREYAAGLERIVADRTAKLHETVQELEAFSYSIAHDMRAPLRSMIGYAEIVREEHAAGINEAGRDYLRRIAASARRLDRLIQDVLNYSRIVREDVTVEPVCTRELTTEVVESYPGLSMWRNRIDVPPDMPVVVGNRSALTQVLSNLLENAVKFVAPGIEPQVRVRWEVVPGPGDDPRPWVRISVADNGIGIDPESRPRLFQMFQRFTSPGQYEGTGIGLAIARKAVDRMGGVIGMESVVGQGSRFWFVLPKAEDREQLSA